MTDRLTTKRREAPLLSSLALLGTLVLAGLLGPDMAEAALKSAAGGGSGDAGGFDRFVRFLDRLTDYAIPVGAAFTALGLIWGGMLFQAGDARAGRVLGGVVLGVGFVLLAKPIAA